MEQLSLSSLNKHSSEGGGLDWVLNSVVDLRDEKAIEEALLASMNMKIEMEASLGVSRESMDSAGHHLRDHFSGEAEALNDMVFSLQRSLDSFRRSSDELRRVGDRLGMLEKERLRLESASALLVLVQELEVDALGDPDYKPVTIEDETRSLLPPSIRDATWLTVCTRLQELRLILADVSSQDVQRARENVTVISEDVESRLLIKFEMVLSALNASGEELVVSPTFWGDEMLVELLELAKMYVECLLCFNNGFAVRKRYLYLSVQSIQELVTSECADLGLVEHVSKLMCILGKACGVQFQLIRQMFPVGTAGRLCRLLLQRLYSDPTINLLEKVATVLNVEEWQSLGDVLDLLVVIREKFAALQITVTECATAPYFASSEFGILLPAVADEEGGSPCILMSENDCFELMTDLVEQALQSHLLMYNQNIVLFVSQQYATLLLGSFDDPRLVRLAPKNAPGFSGGGGGVSKQSSIQSPWVSCGGDYVPEIVPEHFRNFEQIRMSMGTDEFAVRALDVTADALRRLYGIGRTDRGLSERVREIFQCEISFLVDFHMLPWVRGIELLLVELRRNVVLMSRSIPLNDAQIRQSLSREKVSKKGVEAIDSIALWARAYIQYKHNFEATYATGRELTEENEILLCREIHRNTFKMLGKRLTAVLLCLSSSVCDNFSESLEILQSRYDFDMDYVPVTTKPTLACTTICSELKKLTSAIKMREGIIRDASESVLSTFRVAMSANFCAALISHIRSLSISKFGASTLDVDLMHYQITTQECGMEEAAEMMGDLCVIASAFKSPSSSTQVDIQELSRVYNEAVVVILAGSRSDSNEHWYHNMIDSRFAGSIPQLPWDVDMQQSVNRKEIYGPRTLRRRRNSSKLISRVYEAATTVKVPSSMCSLPTSEKVVAVDQGRSQSPVKAVVPVPDDRGTKQKGKGFFQSFFS